MLLLYCVKQIISIIFERGIFHLPISGLIYPTIQRIGVPQPRAFANQDPRCPALPLRRQSGTLIWAPPHMRSTLSWKHHLSSERRGQASEIFAALCRDAGQGPLSWDSWEPLLSLLSYLLRVLICAIFCIGLIE
jgi:hypothetical protein